MELSELASRLRRILPTRAHEPSSARTLSFQRISLGLPEMSRVNEGESWRHDGGETSYMIRTRSPEDLPALKRALEDVYNTDGYPVEGTSKADSFISPDGALHAWIATQGGLVVGQIVLISGSAVAQRELIVGKSGHRAALQAWIDRGGSIEHTALAARLFVRKSARSTGLGAELVLAACKWASVNNLRIVINVLDKDHAAIRLYEKLGFRQIGEAVYGGGPEPCGQFFYVDAA